MSSTNDINLNGVLPAHEKSDMVLVGTVIRRIFRNNAKETARHLLSEAIGLNFWYHPGMHVTSQCYWSENHSMMYTTSEYLLRRLCDEPVSIALRNRLLLFLQIKARFGLSEFMSPVYLTYTLCSLLNLIDYEKSDKEIQALAKKIVDDVATQLLAITLPNGTYISPHGRGYEGFRKKIKGHHLDLFIEFVRYGKTRSGREIGAELFEVLKDTTYQYTAPKESMLESNTNNSNIQFQLYHLSPQREVLERLIEDADDDVYLTILWSHGIYFPLKTKSASRILRTMRKLNLWHHPHFRAGEKYVNFVSCFPDSFVASILVNFTSCFHRGFVSGSYLTDASMTVYREDNVILSALSGNYNTGMKCFQQWPWAINLNGVPVWCAYGIPSDGGLGQFGSTEARDMASSAVIPRMHQDGRALVVDYREKCGGCCFRLPPCSFPCCHGRKEDNIEMYWPLKDFDEYGQKRGWSWARKGTACCAYTFLEKKVIKVVVCDQQNIGILALLEEMEIGKNMTFDQARAQERMQISSSRI